VEVIGKSDVWRKIRDWQGTEGWVHQRMLAESRGVIVRGAVRPLHSDPDPASAIVARAEPGVIAKLLECRGAWCRVETSDIRGWLGRNEVWGVDPDEDVH
jgi:SH3-like domain-containing protein